MWQPRWTIDASRRGFAASDGSQMRSLSIYEFIDIDDSAWAIVP